MATWKKVLVSGSSIAVNELTASGHINAFTSSIHSIGPITSSGGVSASGTYIGKSDATSFIGTASYAENIGKATLTDGKIIIGDASNEAAEFELSGDIGMTRGGVVTIGANKVDGSKLTDNVTIAGNFAVNGTTTLGNAAADVISVKGNITGSVDGTISQSKFITDEVTGIGVTGLTLTTNVTASGEISASLGFVGDLVGTASFVADDGVKTSSITNANVTLAKLANAAANTVIVRDANSAGVLSAKAVTNTQILIGDGTGFTAAALSGDASMTNGGVVDVAKIKGVAFTAERATQVVSDNIQNINQGLSTTSNVTFGNLANTGTTALGNGVADTVTVAGNLTASAGTISSSQIIADEVTGIGVTGLTLTTNVTASGEISASLGFVGDLVGTASFVSSIAGAGITDGKILIGDSSNNAAEFALSGDIGMTRGGVVTIGNDKVTIAKMAGLARGKIIAGDSSGDPAALALGSANTVLQSDGTDLSYGTVAHDMIADNAVDGDKLADDIVIANDLTVTGDLLVSGDTTTLHTANLTVEDKFIMVASSSGAPNVDGGVIVQTTNLKGAGIGYDNSAERWVVTGPDVVAQDATAFAANAAGAPQMLVAVSHSAAKPSGNPVDFGVDSNTRIGMMHVETDTEDIYIFS